MATIYYLARNNASNFVIATNGKTAKVYDGNSDGTDCNTGIDLWAEDAVEKLREEYAKIDGLYSMDDIVRDFGDTFNWDDWCESDDNELIAEIARVEV